MIGHSGVILDTLMPEPLITWRQLLRGNARRFLTWLKATDARQHQMERLCADMVSYARTRLADATSCLAFWEAIPKTRSGCNDLSIFNSPEAVLAYAFQHLPRRYLRTWNALLMMTASACLPLGTEGVRVLDIGTGPGTTAFAISDFYERLRIFGSEQAVEAFQLQVPQFSTAESNEWMSQFMGHFAELSGRPGPFGATYLDFSKFDPQAERIAHYDRLLDEEYFDYELQQYENVNVPFIAHLEAQRIARFRLVVMSYFLTTRELLDQIEPVLINMARDLRPGAVVVLIGAPGHDAIHTNVEALVRAAHFRKLQEIPDDMETGTSLERVIKRAQYEIYQHVASITGESVLTRDGYPNFWTAESSAKVRTGFRLTAFRKGRWPATRSKWRQT
jgi:SAM-dependent methyltransferase